MEEPPHPQSSRDVLAENASNAIWQEANVRVYCTGKSPQLVVSREQEARVVCGAWVARCWERSSGAVVDFDQQPAHLPQLVSQATSPGNWGLSAEEVASRGQNALWRPPVSQRIGDGGTLEFLRERQRETEDERERKDADLFPFLYRNLITGRTNYR